MSGSILFRVLTLFSQNRVGRLRKDLPGGEYLLRNQAFGPTDQDYVLCCVKHGNESFVQRFQSFRSLNGTSLDHLSRLSTLEVLTAV
jgi:hypothetical protein